MSLFVFSMIFAVVVFHLLMIGIFALKQNPTVATLSIPPLFLTIIFHIFINTYWKKISMYMELYNSSLIPDVDENYLQVMHYIPIASQMS